MNQKQKIDLNKLMVSIFSRKKEEGGAVEGQKNSLLSKTEAAIKKISIKDFFKNPPFFLSSFSKKSPSFITGLDIGISGIKSALYKCDGASSMRLASLDIEEISHEEFFSPSRMDSVKSKIKKMQARSAIKGEVSISLPMPNLLVETMYLPVMPQEELDRAIRWEAKDKLLIDQDSSIIDYMVLGDISSGQQVRKEILFFSIPKKDIIDNHQALVGLGLQIKVIRPAFLATIQGLESRSLWSKDEMVGILDIGASNSRFSIISGNSVHFNRTFNVSGDSITNSIADYCRISYEEAEKTKRDIGVSKMVLEEDRKEGGISDQPLVRVSHAAGLHLDQLITEIQHTVDYYNYEVSGAKVSKINRLILSGGGAAMAGIADFFKGRLNVTVDIPDPLSFVKMEPGNLLKMQVSENNLRFASAIGLAERR